MRKLKPLHEIPVLSREWWERIGNRARAKLVSRTKAGKDYLGRQFRPYAKGYRELKQKNEMKRQSSVQTNPPDLTLTGDMLRDCQVLEVSKEHFKIGFPTFAERVISNEERGRAISSDEHPYGVDVDGYIWRQFVRALDKNLEDSAGSFQIKIDL